MNDRELLEMAAKACGFLHVDYAGFDYDGSDGIDLIDGIGRHCVTWNPLKDDGDALRLAVNLGFASSSFQNATRFRFIRSAARLASHSTSMCRPLAISKRAASSFKLPPRLVNRCHENPLQMQKMRDTPKA